MVWLGLKCSDTSPGHCLWDDGLGAATPYNAFYQGYPSVEGACVLMLTGDGPTDGHWISGDCDALQVGFVCQVDATTPQERCGDFAEYNDECYQHFAPLSMAAAESVCTQRCAHLASVHNSAENLFISKLFGTSAAYALVGLARQTHGSYSWTDQTPFDYNNFGNNNTAYGECVSMSLLKDLVDVGQWITVGCSLPLPFVCKRDVRTVMKTAPIQLKMREQRLRWYEHILRRQEDHPTKLALNFEALGKRPRGAPRKRWRDVIKRDLAEIGAAPDDTLDRMRWRRITRAADPATARD
ncbi:unnamed protein product [Heligmosomoides polygyrus]|uniref:C-type lectin domain-containing protein n=1 Tax=Heligmosomoides polygyrus TaxID=6339 RepID=A0A3P8C905_HELPZ|nr:unnamed protein product [Heligmosomoides polygyrus]